LADLQSALPSSLLFYYWEFSVHDTSLMTKITKVKKAMEKLISRKKPCGVEHG
jgi:hypothetical protein